MAGEGGDGVGGGNACLFVSLGPGDSELSPFRDAREPRLLPKS